MAGQMVDLIIVGAGPVGNWLAGKIAQSGRHVLVMDAKQAAGTGICCTGIISSECYDRYVKETGVRSRSAGSARLISPGGDELRVSKEPAPACIIDRPAFDSALASRAQAAGAEYLFNTRVTHIKENVSGCVVNFLDREGGHELGARVVALACGSSSDLPRQVGFGQAGIYRAGAQLDVETAVAEVEVYFDPVLFPGGFGWLVPTWEGRGLAGVVTTRQAGVALEIFLRRLTTQRKTGLKLSNTRQKALPLRPLSRTSSRRVLAVGEAAGQVKATTFGGIFTGLCAAEEAAAVLEIALAADAWVPGLLAVYDRGWRGRMQADLRKGWHARRFYDALSAAQVDRAFALVKSAGLDHQLLGEHDFSFDWHGALLGRLLSRPKMLAGLISIHTLGALPDLMALVWAAKGRG